MASIGWGGGRVEVGIRTVIVGRVVTVGLGRDSRGMGFNGVVSGRGRVIMVGLGWR